MLWRFLRLSARFSRSIHVFSAPVVIAWKPEVTSLWREWVRERRAKIDCRGPVFRPRTDLPSLDTVS